MELTRLEIGEQAVVTALNLNFEARKKLLTYGIGLGTLIKREYSPSISALVNLNIKGKSVCLRMKDAESIEVVKYLENE